MLSQIVRLLQVQDVSANLCCLDVLRLLSVEANTVKTLGGLVLYDILDSIQVSDAYSARLFFPIILTI